MVKHGIKLHLISQLTYFDFLSLVSRKFAVLSSPSLYVFKV